MLTCGSCSSRDRKSLKTPSPRLRPGDKSMLPSQSITEGNNTVPLFPAIFHPGLGASYSEGKGPFEKALLGVIKVD